MNTDKKQTALHGSGVIRVHLCLSVVKTFCLVIAVNVHAQDYPSRPLRLITGFLPGGVSDTIARVTGEKLGERVIIDAPAPAVW